MRAYNEHLLKLILEMHPSATHAALAISMKGFKSEKCGFAALVDSIKDVTDFFVGEEERLRNALNDLETRKFIESGGPGLPDKQIYTITRSGRAYLRHLATDTQLNA